jgi:hypothetical protein
MVVSTLESVWTEDDAHPAMTSTRRASYAHTREKLNWSSPDHVAYRLTIYAYLGIRSPALTLSPRLVLTWRALYEHDN